MVKVKLIVELREDNKVYVTGPLHDKDLCNAMLDEAKEAVKNAKQTRIFIPTKEVLNKMNR